MYKAVCDKGPIAQDNASRPELSRYQHVVTSNYRNPSDIPDRYNQERVTSGQSIASSSTERPPFSSSPVVTPSPSVTAPSTTEKAKATVKEFGINLEKPKHPEFAVLSNRIHTFDNHWPASLRQTPKELALCGFFYGGTGDTVFCFFCGQGLHSWEESDIPWEEHAKWSPNCVFLRNVKGQEFIDIIKVKDTNPEKFLQWKQEEEEKHQRKKPSRLERDCRPKVTNGFSDDLLTLPAVVSITEVFGRQKAVDAIKVFIQQTGKTDFSSEDLANIVFDLEDHKIQVPKQVFKGTTEEVDGPHQGQEAVIDEELGNLMEENLSLRKQTTCLVCRSELVSVVFLPCGHICCCADCSPAMKDCPLCKAFVKGTVRTYLT